jgi:hypothetical protein
VNYSADDPVTDSSYLEITPVDLTDRSNSMTEMHFDSGMTDGKETVEISEGGDYCLSGSLNGVIHISTKDQIVHLYLNGFDLVSGGGPAILCENADKLVITLMEGTENSVSDSGDYRGYDDAEACITSESDITINGTGILNVNGYYKDAIRSKDILKILSGTIAIQCKRNAVYGNDGILVHGGKLTVSSEKYGFRTVSKGAEGRGNLIITGCEMNLIAGRYGFVTEKADLYIYNCAIVCHNVMGICDTGGNAYIEENCVDEH